MNKIKHILIYFLSIILTSFLLSGCASNTLLLNRNKLRLSNKKSVNKVDELKTKVLRISLKLNGIPNKTIKRLFRKTVNIEGEKTGLSFNPYTANYEKKLPVRNDYTIPINKTVKSVNKKFELKIKSIRIERIFWVINFSIENLSAYNAQYRIMLVHKLHDREKIIAFKSNLNGRIYSNLNSSTQMDGSIVFLTTRNLSGIIFIIFIKTVKDNRTYRLIYNF